MLYADDVQIYHIFYMDQIDAGIVHMQLNAQAVADWATVNGLKLYIRKTNVMIFGSLQYLTTLSKRKQPIAPIKINGIPIPYVETVKNLGILMTPTLNWQPQVAAITNKIYSSLSSLKFHRKSLTQTLKKYPIQSLALLHFDYCSIVYMHVDKIRALAL